MSDPISQLSIRALLAENVEYVIPMYQRNYAWSEGEITQLIQDVIDYMLKESDASRNYYIGTLVVSTRSASGKTVHETIDGQQRLTTLSLLASHLKNTGEPALAWYDALRIRFESRERSQKTFAAVFAGALEPVPTGFFAPQDGNEAIIDGYRQIQKILPHKLKENKVTSADFARYLLEHVVLMRVGVPPQTDLNHYFEIMNSRGEQLEKHEVLKARMMEALAADAAPEHSRHALHLVWEACANMERYVQMGFTPAQRDALFRQGDWGRFLPTDFADVCAALAPTASVAGAARQALTLDELIAPVTAPRNAGGAVEEKGEEAPERFHAVINFPNFLLHVLRVMTDANVALDDKTLIAAFDTHVFKAPDPVAAIRRFTFTLLRCKYLFDHYVIKREFAKGTDGWSLKRFKWNAASDRRGVGRPSYVNTFGADDAEGEAKGENGRILTLLSAFHVSTPTRVYKYWLNAALKYLHDTHPAQDIREGAYLSYLESVAQAFVFDRYLAGDDKAAYFEIIHVRAGRCQRQRHEIDASDIAARLAYKQIENNLVFNYLDYLLWLQPGADSAVGNFEFTFRSSVEHYYPQHPMEGQPCLAPDLLDAFGNLCLISHSKNSRLSNFMPEAKKEYYRNNRIDSIKQHLMMKHEDWDTDAIRRHGQAMIDVLVERLEQP